MASLSPGLIRLLWLQWEMTPQVHIFERSATASGSVWGGCRPFGMGPGQWNEVTSVVLYTCFRFQVILFASWYHACYTMATDTPHHTVYVTTQSQ